VVSSAQLASLYRHLVMYRDNCAAGTTTIPCLLFMLNFRLIVDNGLISEVCCDLMASRLCIPLSSRSLSTSNLGLSLFPIPASHCNVLASVQTADDGLIWGKYSHLFRIKSVSVLLLWGQRSSFIVLGLLQQCFLKYL
jgi:hypothetical protein